MMRSLKQNALTGFREIDTSNSKYKYKHYPAYGKLLRNLRRAGKIPSQIVMVVFNWEIARAYPRIVISDEITIENLEFVYLAGLPVQIICHNKDVPLVDTLAQAILKVNPSFLSTFNLDLLGTDKVRRIIKSYELISVKEVV